MHVHHSAAAADHNQKIAAMAAPARSCILRRRAAFRAAGMQFVASTHGARFAPIQ